MKRLSSDAGAADAESYKIFGRRLVGQREPRTTSGQIVLGLNELAG